MIAGELSIMINNSKKNHEDSKGMLLDAWYVKINAISNIYIFYIYIYTFKLVLIDTGMEWKRKHNGKDAKTNQFISQDEGVDSNCRHLG